LPDGALGCWNRHPSQRRAGEAADRHDVGDGVARADGIIVTEPPEDADLIGQLEYASGKMHAYTGS
jgi:hypothetical protein